MRESSVKYWLNYLPVFIILAVLAYGICQFVVLLLLLTSMPHGKCDPDEMAGHYELKKAEMEELVAFTRSALDEGQNIFIELEKGGVRIRSGEGLDAKEIHRIKRLLKQSKCISIYTHYPEYCEIGFKWVGFGRYSYRFYLNPMNEEQKQETLSNDEFIPYNDTVVLVYGGGAVGPQSFPSEVKRDFLERHPQN